MSGDESAGGRSTISQDFDQTISGSSIADKGRASGAFGYMADPSSGVLKLSSGATLGLGLKDESRAGGNAKFDISETFLAQGSGSATFQFDVDGVMSLGPLPADLDQFTAGTSVNTELKLTTRDGNRLVTQRDQGGATHQVINGRGSTTTFTEIVPFSPVYEFHDLLEVTLDLIDGQEVMLDVSFFQSASASGNSGSALSDFTNTGYLNFTTTAGLDLVASDTRFLATATGRPSVSPAPVPLPAGTWMMLTALVGLFQVGMRKRPA